MPEPQPTSWISSKLNKCKVRSFANRVDTDYDNAMHNCVGYVEVHRPLINDPRAHAYDSEFRTEFPPAYFIVAPTVLSKHFSARANELAESNVTDLNYKRRGLLRAFLLLIRATSGDLLSHWARVEPCGFHFKGYKFTKSRTRGSNASWDICTYFTQQDAIFYKCFPTF